jgi:hypothetical protein
MIVYVVISHHKKYNTFDDVAFKKVSFQLHYFDYWSKPSIVVVSKENH